MAAMLARAKRVVVLGLASLGISVAWAQQPSRAQLEALTAQMLASMAGDDTRLELAVSNLYGRDLAPEKRMVAKAMLRSMLSNERMPRYLVQVIAPVVSPLCRLSSTVRRGQLAEFDRL